jgi:hypothetical protein
MTRPYIVVRIGGQRFTNERAEALLNYANKAELVQLSKDANQHVLSAMSAINELAIAERDKTAIDSQTISDTVQAAGTVVEVEIDEQVEPAS